MLTIKRVLVLLGVAVMTACGTAANSDLYRELSTFLSGCDPASIRYRTTGTPSRRAFVVMCRDDKTLR